GYNDYLKIFGNLFQALNSSRITEASLLFNSFKSQKVEKEIIAEILGQQSEQSIYHFDGYKTNKSAPYQLTLEIHTEEDDIAKSIENGEAIATAVNLARDYGNIPPNILTP
ncbi:leucyl aminopeptidase family protein, partial [Mesorhizobium sp. M8A.F.Ca.ET.202.01.1.1]